MYCKHCGQQIADDSKYCQHCGGKQDDSFTQSIQEKSCTDTPKVEKTVGYSTVPTAISEKTKWYIIGYGLWLAINLYWLFAGNKSSSASEYFQPFSNQMNSSMSYYDISEFVTYIIGLPLLIIALVKINKKLNED